MSAASIPGASDTLISLLSRQLEARPGSNPDGYQVKLFRSADYIGPPTNTISLLLYRVDADVARRFGDSQAMPASTPGARWQGLELSYLLTVWGQTSAIGEQRMLQICMEILQEFAIVQGSWLSPAYSWGPEDALRISLAPMNHEDLMRLWDGFDLPYQLSVRLKRLVVVRYIGDPPIGPPMYEFIQWITPDMEAVARALSPEPETITTTMIANNHLPDPALEGQYRGNELIMKVDFLGKNRLVSVKADGELISSNGFYQKTKMTL